MLRSVKNNRTPDPDKIDAYPVKRLSNANTFLVNTFIAFENNKPIPDWLIKGTTILLPINQETGISKNYHPKACLKITYKLYTCLLKNPWKTIAQLITL